MPRVQTLITGCLVLTLALPLMRQMTLGKLLISLSLGFLICKMGIMIGSILSGCCEDLMVSCTLSTWNSAGPPYSSFFSFI